MKRTALVSALLLLAGIVLVPAYAQSPIPVAGKDYVVIPNGQPLSPADGKIVVEEFFNYICPACNAFEPMFVAWTKQLPSYVKVEHVPAAFRADFVQYARAYYAAKLFGIADETHQAVYDAIHRDHVLPAEGDSPDEERIADFYANYGVSAQKFLAAMQSFGVDSNVRRAMAHLRVSNVRGTPSIVVNGRYLVQGKSFEDILRIASFLIEKEHARMLQDKR